MLINEKTALSSSRVLLVPYCKHHVPQYHEWMKDPVGLYIFTYCNSH
ncbi:N-acetyltransferase [Histoplasma ohiense]|nr:N-acetyltransferase [Histoplasma ohiense (nom. inval.)]